MQKIIIGVIVSIGLFFMFKFFGNKHEDQTVLIENSLLIQEQIQNVGKLVVTEGHFSEVFTYKKSKAIFGNLITAEKKALVVVNADVSIAYDLSKVEFQMDEESKTLTLKHIPDEEIKISPEFEYYDIQSDFLNRFEANDYNNIKTTVKEALQEKIEASELKANAKNRLISELSKFYILTNSLGWTLKYNETFIDTPEVLNNIKL